MLRAFSMGGGVLDVGALHLQRKQALEAKRQQHPENKVCRPVLCMRGWGIVGPGGDPHADRLLAQGLS